MRRIPPLLLAGALILGIAAPLAGCVSADRGREIYTREKCPSCHQFRGEGGSLAPDLTAVSARRSDAWLRRQILSPKKNDPDSRMPAYGHLSRSEIRSLLAYLKN